MSQGFGEESPGRQKETEKNLQKRGTRGKIEIGRIVCGTKVFPRGETNVGRRKAEKT